jgi:hypothetical protein
MKKIIFFTTIIGTMFFCEPRNTDECHRKIAIMNNSDKSIYVNDTGRYPDTDFRNIVGNPLVAGTKIGAKESESAALSNNGECIEYKFTRFESGIMQVFVFDGPTLETNGWEYVKENNLVLKRYQFTLQDMQNNNWTITYP